MLKRLSHKASQTSKMDLTSILFVVSLHCVWMANADQRKSFVKYQNNSASSESEEGNIVSLERISCARDCLRTYSCLAFSVSSSTCSLYYIYIDDPTIQHIMQTGETFYTTLQKISVTTEDTNQWNGGWANFFPQLRINKAGRVLKWEVRCAFPGVVVLAIWRGEIAPFVRSSITLIGKHHITIQDGMQNQLITYDVPVEETVLVESGDFVGFHYDDNEAEARVKTIVGNQTPEGVTIDNAYGQPLHHNQIPIGGTIGVFESVIPVTPSLALYIV